MISSLSEMGRPACWCFVAFYILSQLLVTNGQNVSQQHAQLEATATIVNNVDVEEILPHRIVGGRPISIENAKWQIALLENGVFICGGTIISRVWIVTAAHCITAGRTYAVRAGSRLFRSGGQTRYVRIIYMNGKYNANTNANDIALLRLNRALIFNRKVGRVLLPSYRRPLKQHYLISGWGSIRESGYASKVLRATIVNLVSRSTCVKKYSNIGGVPRGVICAAASGRDSCQGDSGGGLVNHRVLYGIVSFGIGCARRRFPGVYTDMRYQLRWIKNVLRKEG